MNQTKVFETICLVLVVIATITIGKDCLLLHRLRLANSTACEIQKE